MLLFSLIILKKDLSLLTDLARLDARLMAATNLTRLSIEW